MAIASRRRFSDDQLASVELRVADPRALEGLNPGLPDPALTPQILFEYDVTPKGGRSENPDHPFVWCTHCQRDTHWHGFVITNDTGDRYLLGSLCGPKYYGLSFSGARRSFQEEAQRQAILERLRSIMANAARTRETATVILRGDGLRMIDEKRAELKRAAPNMLLRLSAKINAGGQLEEIVSYRDIEAERVRDERHDDNKDRGPIYSQRMVAIGPLEGQALVTDRGDSREAIINLLRSIEEVEALSFAGTDTVSTGVLVKRVRAVEEALREAHGSLQRSRAAPAFFSRANVDRLSRWSAASKGYSIGMVDGGIQFLTQHEGRSIVAQLGDVLIPPLFPDRY